MHIRAWNNTGTAALGASAAMQGGGGGGMSASFTTYGGCARATLQCGWYTPWGSKSLMPPSPSAFFPKGHPLTENFNHPAFTAAIAQHAFGAGPGDPGPACNRCYQISAPGANTIVVKVADLCPADPGNPLCTKPGDGQGSVADIHVDLCEDSGASAAFFGGGPKLITSGGTAKVVDCSQLAGSGPEIGNDETIRKGYPTDIHKNCQTPHLDNC
ncbi:MAG: hypothetical protein M1836_007130 [Candelina mexicana]|nr:MAG: hypothetical protein M1836_007130 [Candelina mexicana]